MKISRRSWHYRLYRYLKNVQKGPRYLVPFGVTRTDVEIPRNLCPYFWSLVIGVIGTAFVFVVFAVALVPVTIVSVLAAVRRKIDRKMRARSFSRARREKQAEPKDPPEAKQPSLVRSFARAHKDQVCPPLRLVD